MRSQGLDSSWPRSHNQANSRRNSDNTLLLTIGARSLIRSSNITMSGRWMSVIARSRQTGRTSFSTKRTLSRQVLVRGLR